MGSLYAPLGSRGEHNFVNPDLPLHAQTLVSLDELVKDGVNGLVFHNAEQLAAQLEVRLSSSHHKSLTSTPSRFAEPPSRIPFGTRARDASRIVRAQRVRQVAHKEPRHWWTGVGVGHLVGKLGPRYAPAVAA